MVFEDSGGDSAAVRTELRHVQHIAASNGAFAALRSDGSVVTWGDADYGGDSGDVQDQLRRAVGEVDARNAGSGEECGKWWKKRRY